MTKSEKQEHEELLIFEKRARVNFEEARGLADRPADENLVTYIKNKATRIIEYVKNVEMNWIRRERIVRQEWNVQAKGWVDARSPTEVVEFINRTQKNEDILPTDAFVDQGTSQPKEPKFPSDKIIFRECVVAKDGKLLAFHVRIDEQEPAWRKTEWLMEKLECSEEEAYRFSNAFKELQFDRKTVLGLIEPIKEDPDHLEYFEALVDELPIVQKGPLSGRYSNNREKKSGIKEETLSIIEDQTSEYSLAAAFPGGEIRLKKSYVQIEEPEEETEPKSTTFGMHALHFGEEGCSHEFLTFLRFATIKEIKGTMKGFFKTKNQWGYEQRARFWYLTPSQRSQCWVYINQRRIELGIYTGSMKFKKA